MQSYRSVSRLPVTQTKRVILTTPTRKMSFFLPRTFAPQESSVSFTPLFRLLDDFDSYSRGAPNHRNYQRRGCNVIKSFSPRFDVREIGDAYELHGELPGVDQSQVDIEFTDAQTLVIRGHTERTRSSGTAPADYVEVPKAVEAATEPAAVHQATVEDEDTVNVLTPETTTEGTEAAKEEKKAQEPQQTQEPQEKYWVSERSIGNFSRSFTFPVRVDSESVQASMKNGILSIVIPKAKKDEVRKITIA